MLRVHAAPVPADLSQVLSCRYPPYVQLVAEPRRRPKTKSGSPIVICRAFPRPAATNPALPERSVPMDVVPEPHRSPLQDSLLVSYFDSLMDAEAVDGVLDGRDG